MNSLTAIVFWQVVPFMECSLHSSCASQAQVPSKPFVETIYCMVLFLADADKVCTKGGLWGNAQNNLSNPQGYNNNNNNNQ